VGKYVLDVAENDEFLTLFFLLGLTMDKRNVFL
jgi:hypothetical protein